MTKISLTILSYLLVEAVVAIFLSNIGKRMLKLKNQSFNFILIFILLNITSLTLFVFINMSEMILRFNVEKYLIPEIIATSIFFGLLTKQVKLHKKDAVILALFYFAISLIMEFSFLSIV